MSVGCRIKRDIPRPDPKLVERFRDLPVANIDDTEGRDFAMNHRIRLMNRSRKLVGPAFTVKVPEGDNVMLNKAMDLARPGDVLVVDAGVYFHYTIDAACMTRNKMHKIQHFGINVPFFGINVKISAILPLTIYNSYIL